MTKLKKEYSSLEETVKSIPSDLNELIQLKEYEIKFRSFVEYINCYKRIILKCNSCKILNTEINIDSINMYIDIIHSGALEELKKFCDKNRTLFYLQHTSDSIKIHFHFY